MALIVSFFVESVAARGRQSKHSLSKTNSNRSHAIPRALLACADEHAWWVGIFAMRLLHETSMSSRLGSAGADGENSAMQTSTLRIPSPRLSGTINACHGADQACS